MGESKLFFSRQQKSKVGKKVSPFFVTLLMNK